MSNFSGAKRHIPLFSFFCWLVQDADIMSDDQDCHWGLSERVMVLQLCARYPIHPDHFEIGEGVLHKIAFFSQTQIRHWEGCRGWDLSKYGQTKSPRTHQHCNVVLHRNNYLLSATLLTYLIASLRPPCSRDKNLTFPAWRRCVSTVSKQHRNEDWDQSWKKFWMFLVSKIRLTQCSSNLYHCRQSQLRKYITKLVEKQKQSQK